MDKTRKISQQVFFKKSNHYVIYRSLYFALICSWISESERHGKGSEFYILSFQDQLTGLTKFSILYYNKITFAFEN